MVECKSVLMVKGEAYPCTQMSDMVEGSLDHNGWAHSNQEAQAIWGERKQ